MATPCRRKFGIKWRLAIEFKVSAYAPGERTSGLLRQHYAIIWTWGKKIETSSDAGHDGPAPRDCGPAPRERGVMPIVDGKYRRPRLRNSRINYRFGWFFVTFQVFQNKSELGAIVGDKCVLNALGEAVENLIKTGNLILKISNGCHDSVYIKKNNSENYIKEIKKKVTYFFNRDYSFIVPEFFHDYSKKRIVLEKLFSPIEDLNEFKYMIFNNEIKMIYLLLFRQKL